MRPFPTVEHNLGDKVKRRFLALFAATALLLTSVPAASASPQHVCLPNDMQVNTYKDANLGRLYAQTCVASSVTDTSWNNAGGPYVSFDNQLSSVWVYVPNGAGCVTWFSSPLYGGSVVFYRLVVGSELTINQFNPNDDIGSSKYYKLASTSSTCP